MSNCFFKIYKFFIFNHGVFLTKIIILEFESIWKWGIHNKYLSFFYIFHLSVLEPILKEGNSL